MPTHAADPVNFDAWDGFRLESRPDDRHWVMFSPYTYHYSYSEEHRPVRLLGYERERATGQLAGAAIFSNSFGQPSVYAYPWGHKFDLTDYPGTYIKLTGGVIWGYKPPYDKKIPLNTLGVAPAVIFSVGREWGPWQAGVTVLGNAALMLKVSRRL